MLPSSSLASTTSDDGTTMLQASTERTSVLLSSSSIMPTSSLEPMFSSVSPKRSTYKMSTRQTVSSYPMSRSTYKHYVHTYTFSSQSTHDSSASSSYIISSVSPRRSSPTTWQTSADQSLSVESTSTLNPTTGTETTLTSHHLMSTMGSTF